MSDLSDEERLQKERSFALLVMFLGTFVFGVSQQIGFPQKAVLTFLLWMVGSGWIVLAERRWSA